MDVARAAMLFLTYLVLAYASLAFIFRPELIATLWLPSGVSLVAFARTSKRAWWSLGAAVFTAELLFSRYLDVPWPISIGWAVGDTLEPLIGAWVLQRSVGTHFRFGSVHDALVLIAAALAGAILSGVISAPFAAAWLPGARFAPALAAWVVGDAASMLTLGVAGLVWTSGSVAPLGRWRRVEFTALLGSLLAMTWLVFRSDPLRATIVPLPYLLFPFTVWAALRFGVRGASTAYSVLAVTSAFFTVRGTGPFASALWPLAQRVLAVEVFLVVNVLVLFVAVAIDTEREALKMRDRFVGLAAHELRTPLTPLRINLYLLRNRVAPELTERVESSIRQVAQLSRLVEDLLDLTRIRSGQLALQSESFDLADVAREVCASFDVEARRAGSEIELQTSPCELVADRHLIGQVVSNLVENAVKYGRGGRIWVRVKPVGDVASLEVADQGPGIAPKNQARVFDAFVRPASEMQQPGLGLGLFLAKQIVARHDGRITLRSAPGQGAEFIVEIPRTSNVRNRSENERFISGRTEESSPPGRGQRRHPGGLCGALGGGGIHDRAGARRQGST